MKTSDKFDQIDCRKDDKARRVSNVAPETVANISAETLERGVTLEALEALNVPVFRYGGQVTIHGKLPDFNPLARPGGHKAIFRNGNGSIGVRYGAIDAEKKKLIARATRHGGEWHSNITSQGLQVDRLFYVKEETQRAKAKLDTLEALKALPVHLFFGDAFAFTLAYGMGYGAGANIGAISANDLWPLIAAITGIHDLVTLEAKEKAANEAEEAKREACRKEYEAEEEKKLAERKAEIAAMMPTLRPVTNPPENGEVVIVSPSGSYVRALMIKEKGSQFYRLLRDSLGYEQRERKLAKDGFPWRKALAAGNVFIPV